MGDEALHSLSGTPRTPRAIALVEGAPEGLLFRVLVAGLFVTFASAVAALLGWQRDLMLLVTVGTGALILLPGLALLARLRDQRGAALHDLLDSQARVRSILDSAMDAIITVDEHDRIVLFNSAAEAVFGCPRAEALGAPLDRFIPHRFPDEQQEAGSQPSAGAHRIGRTHMVTGLRRGGQQFPIEASISAGLEEGHLFRTAILRDVTERVRAQEALRKSQDEIQRLALAASASREQEKSRIARELHDELGQALTALKLDVTWLRGHAAGWPEVQAKLATMQGVLDYTVAATRRISANLRPLMLDDLGLVAAAEWLIQNFTQRTGIPCELVMGDGNFDLPDPHATTVFRALQESLTNAAKHAGAAQVEVALERSGGQIVLTVIDNGAGFSPHESVKPGSFGHLGLRERAYHLGGSLAIHSAPGSGTRVELCIPEPRREPA